MFRRFLYSIQRFMMGRNGFDRITKYTMLAYFVILVVGRVVSFISQSFIVYIAVELIVYALIAYTFFRTLSRNVSKRRAECEKFDRLLEKLGRKKKSSSWQNPFGYNNYNNYETYNTYTPPKPKKSKKPKSDKYTKYVTCKNCKAVLRLKRRKGIHTATCPKCGKDVKVISFR